MVKGVFHNLVRIIDSKQQNDVDTHGAKGLWCPEMTMKHEG